MPNLEKSKMFETENKILKSFLKERELIIDKLSKEEIDKREFLIENFEIIKKFNIKPFNKLNTVNKCLYNYQYYNILAKYYKFQLDSIPNRKKICSRGRLCKCNINNYYIEKDKATFAMLNILGKEDLVSYPLILNSSRLNLKLIEIILLNYDKIILHTISNDIKNELIKKGVFSFSPRESKINHYVNASY